MKTGLDVGPHQKQRHQEGGAHKTYRLKLSWKTKTNMIWPLLEARTQPHVCAKSLRSEVSGRRIRGRPKKKWRHNIKEDMKKYQLTEDMAQDRKYWMIKIMAGPAQRDGQER